MLNLTSYDYFNVIIQTIKLIILFICFLPLSLYHDYYYNPYHINKQNDKNYIVIVLGTRTEAIKMIPIIKQLKKSKNIKCITINTGQQKKMINQILMSLKMFDSIDIELNMIQKNPSFGELTSRTILKFDKIFSSIQPDAVIVQGGTTTSFAAALSAFYQKIPIFNVEAGIRSHNLYCTFPEEFNKLGIDDLSTLYFAATESDASNLIKENKNPNKIYITGNTLVDTLKTILENTSPSKYINSLLNRVMLRCKDCKIILLTCIKKVYYWEQIINILKVVQKLLENFNDIIIILPFNSNSYNIQSIKMGLPEIIFDSIIKGKEIMNPNFLYFNRFFLIKPLNYIDLVHLQSLSFFIMTDSSEIQEIAEMIGKPALILKENTEKLEGIKVGLSILSGTCPEKIFYYASILLNNQTLYKRMSLHHKIFGPGNSSNIIINKIEDFFFNKKLSKSHGGNKNELNIFNYDKIISQYDSSIINSSRIVQYDLVIVLTVWKRNNLNKQLMQIKRQSILNKKRTNIIIFQNSNHVNIDNIVEEWKKPGTFLDSVNITFIKSPIETGYFGRFISPLTSSVTSNTYFIICDDDVIWGDKYFENMIRVVDEGSLATRNGRLLNTNNLESVPNQDIYVNNVQVCYDEDIEYDFGGHIWAGRISWLRKAWSHIPITLENCEDFWLSAILKTFYNISTRTPKCPCPIENPIKPELCAASDDTAAIHVDSSIGKSNVNGTLRGKIINDIVNHFNYKPLIYSDPNIIEKIKNKFIFGNKSYPLFDLSDILWKNALFWQ